jgi:hypothetical protein
MNRPDGLGQPPRPKPEPPRLTFYDLCKMVYKLDYDAMLRIAEDADVSKKVIEDMFCGYIVNRSDAVAVLKAFSETVGATWTIDTVN